ncbi:Paired amphipathic helix protein Sin3b [Tulasnella sp. 403]|nr:Paired amphipathic helix protein Sin3b [Tulasnella sp. 403]
MSSDTTQAPKFQDAIAYLAFIKRELASAPGVYQEFLSITKDFRMNLIDLETFLQRTAELFEHHPHLVTGLNVFVPDGYYIVPSITIATPRKTYIQIPEGASNAQPKFLERTTDPVADRKAQKDWEKAFEYVSKVKARFQDTDPTVYEMFTSLLSTCGPGEDKSVVREKIKGLFGEEHEDLIKGIDAFWGKDKGEGEGEGGDEDWCVVKEEDHLC